MFLLLWAKTNLNYSSEIRFVCADDQTETKVELLDMLPCHPIFKWTSFQVCQSFPRKNGLVKTTMQQQQQQRGGSSSFWSLSVFVIICVMISVFVFRKPEHRERVSQVYRWAKIKLRRGSSSGEDRSLLVENVVTIPAFGSLEVDDDDDLIIA